MTGVLLVVDDSPSARRAAADLDHQVVVRRSDEVQHVPWNSLSAAILPAVLASSLATSLAQTRPRVVVGYGPVNVAGAALLAGCDDILCEPWSALEATIRIERILAHEPRTMPHRSDARAGANRVWHPPCTGAGRAVYALLARHHGRVVDRATIERELAGTGTRRAKGDASRRVDMVVARLRRSLGGSDRQIETVRGRGYRLVDTNPIDCG